MKFSSRREVEKYLSGEKIECLLCGKQFAGLGPHLMFAHQISAREYKRAFGIPYTAGLLSASSNARASRSAKQRREREGEPSNWYHGGKDYHKGARPAPRPAWAEMEFLANPGQRPMRPYVEIYNIAVEAHLHDAPRGRFGRAKRKGEA